jgi:hypothetical protein
VNADPEKIEPDMVYLVVGKLLRPKPRVLVADESTGMVARVLAERGASVATWSRMAAPNRQAAAWPPAVEVDEAVLRISRNRASLEFALHALAARLAPGGHVWVVGTNDEGVRSALREGSISYLKRLRPLMPVGTAACSADVDVRRFLTYAHPWRIGVPQQR